MADYGVDSPTNERLITAYFEDRTSADRAIERLVALGVPQSSVRLTSGSETSGTTSYADTSSREHHKGFWESLADLFLPDEDRYTYAEGLRRGGYVVSARVNQGYYDRALDILDDDGSIDIEERSRNWRSEGWSGYEGRDESYGSNAGSTGYSGASPAGYAATNSNYAGFGERGTSVPSETNSNYNGSRGSSDETTRRDLSGGTGGVFGERTYDERDESIPVAEERLRIGKRDVENGRVRVRSYVIEEPVSEQVSLRQERVDVERRPVDRAATPADDLFHERSIELEERGQEAVVSKEARVTEEVRLRKEAEERTEQVSDTVRRTEVEIEDERSRNRDDLLRRG